MLVCLMSIISYTNTQNNTRKKIDKPFFSPLILQLVVKKSL